MPQFVQWNICIWFLWYQNFVFLLQYLFSSDLKICSRFFPIMATRPQYFDSFRLVQWVPTIRYPMADSNFDHNNFDSRFLKMSSSVTDWQFYSIQFNHNYRNLYQLCNQSFVISVWSRTLVEVLRSELCPPPVLSCPPIPRTFPVTCYWHPTETGATNFLRPPVMKYFYRS